MVEKEKQNKITETLSQQFLKNMIKIGKYLDQPILKPKFDIKYQEASSTIMVSDLGRKFGIIYHSKCKLILGKWLLKLSEKERKILVDFLLVREVFRVYLDVKIPLKYSYEQFFEVIIQIIAILWIMEEYNHKLTSYHISVIRQRTDAYEEKEEEEQILKSDSWVYFLTKCSQFNITAKKLVPVLIERVKDAISNAKSIVDLAWDIMYWLKAHLPEEVSFGLPHYIKKRNHFDIIKLLGETSYQEASALNLSKILGKSHNSITTSFKQIMDNYGIYWWPNINNQKIRLYQFFLRINTKKKEFHKLLVEKLMAIRYIRFIRESVIEKENIIVGWLDSPLIVSEQLLEFLEKMKRNELISDYFIKQIRRKKITWSITTKKLEPKVETYQILLNEPEKYNCATITVMDDKYEIANLPEEKEEIFNEDVLMFISTLMSHHLGKSNIIFKPIELIYELCEKNNIKSENSSAVLDFVNQMEIRCRRLKVFEYSLNFREFALFKYGLYIELLVNSNVEIIENIVEKLEITGEMLRISLIDKVVLIFPDVKYGSIFREILEELFKEKNVQIYTLQLNYHRGLKIPKFQYIEAYDFINDKWKTTD